LSSRPGPTPTMLRAYSAVTATRNRSSDSACVLSAIIGIPIPVVNRDFPYYNQRVKAAVTFPPGKKQRRSQETRDLLLDAAEAVLREDGLADLKIVSVVERANSSVGAFYRRFSDRDALLYAVQERNHAHARELYDQQLTKLQTQDLSLSETLAEMFAFRAKMIARDAPLLHAFVVQEALGPAFQEEGRRFFAYCRSAMTHVVVSHKDEIAHPNPALAAEVVCRTWLALMEQVVLYGASPFDVPGPSADVDTLVAEFTRAMVGYLRGNALAPCLDPVRCGASD
jgi:AcrR family transcriptional regulator